MHTLLLSEACCTNKDGLDFRLVFSKMRPFLKYFDKKQALAKELNPLTHETTESKNYANFRS